MYLLSKSLSHWEIRESMAGFLYISGVYFLILSLLHIGKSQIIFIALSYSLNTSQNTSVTRCVAVFLHIPGNSAPDTNWLLHDLIQSGHYQPGSSVRSHSFMVHFHNTVPSFRCESQVIGCHLCFWLTGCELGFQDILTRLD